MKIEYTEKELNRYHITEEDFLVLYLLYKNIDIYSTIEKLKELKLVAENPLSATNLICSSKVEDIVNKIILNSNEKVTGKDTEFQKIAIAMKEVYPKGTKPGTNYLWRGNTTELVRKLKILAAKYNFTCTKEQAVEATKKYVQSFNGNYDKMRLLKYFILKTVVDSDGNSNIVSDFMSLIENEGQEDVNNDWTTNCI